MTTIDTSPFDKVVSGEMTLDEAVEVLRRRRTWLDRLRSLLNGIGSCLQIWPSREPPVELSPPKSVEKAFRIDAEKLRGDCGRVVGEKKMPLSVESAAGLAAGLRSARTEPIVDRGSFLPNRTDDASHEARRIAEQCRTPSS